MVHNRWFYECPNWITAIIDRGIGGLKGLIFREIG